jgi:hypothetical protein
LLVFKLFPIGYGPTPSKRKDIVLEQEIVKGFELVLYRKKERILLREGFLVCKVSGRCERDFFKSVVSSFKIFFITMS